MTTDDRCVKLPKTPQLERVHRMEWGSLQARTGMGMWHARSMRGCRIRERDRRHADTHDDGTDRMNSPTHRQRSASTHSFTWALFSSQNFLGSYTIVFFVLF